MTEKSKGQEILDSRAATYGDRKTNMEAMAMMVNGYLMGVKVRNGTGMLESQDFAAIMMLYKAYRFAVTPDYADNINDIEGYAKMMRECVEDRLIEAATAEEYQRKKADQEPAREQFEPLKVCSACQVKSPVTTMHVLDGDSADQCQNPSHNR